MTTAIEGGFLFEDVLPEPALRGEAQRVFDEIANWAPYGASFDARITRADAGYRVVILIHSVAGRFQASSQCENLLEGLSRLEHEMLRKFESWRHDRFAHPVDAREEAA